MTFLEETKITKKKWLLVSALCFTAMSPARASLHITFEFPGATGDFTTWEVDSVANPDLALLGLGKVKLTVYGGNVNGDHRMLHNGGTDGRVAVRSGWNTASWDGNTGEMLVVDVNLYDPMGNPVEGRITLKEFAVRVTDVSSAHIAYAGSGALTFTGRNQDLFLGDILMSTSNDPDNANVAASGLLVAATAGEKVPIKVKTSEGSAFLFSSEDIFWIRRINLGDSYEHQLESITIDTDPYQVAYPSDPSITTHEIASGEVILGISDMGGGYINKLDIPGYGDIMGPVTDRFGRGGQTAIRDGLHRGKYNPTQAGFSDRAGTVCHIDTSPGMLTVDARPCTLWRGDNKYDFIRWENLASDGYNEDGDNSDVDGIDEEDLPGRQATELTSEFDFYCTYEDVMGAKGIHIPCFRHYFEFRFIREPGDCLNQFGPQAPVFTPANLNEDISVESPQGIHPATPFDMSEMISRTTLRADRALWTPQYRHWLTPSGTWQSEPRLESRRFVIGTSDVEARPLLILSDSRNMDQAPALGLYWPASAINTRIIVGKTDIGEVVYTDDRRGLVYMIDTPQRIPTMQKFGFGYNRISGMLNRGRTPAGVYELFRGEMYVLVGTPNEIKASAERIEHEL